MFAAQLTLRVTLAWYDTGRWLGITAYLGLAKLMIPFKCRVSAGQLWMYWDRIMSFYISVRRKIYEDAEVKDCTLSACKLRLLNESYFKLRLSAWNFFTSWNWEDIFITTCETRCFLVEVCADGGVRQWLFHPIPLCLPRFYIRRHVPAVFPPGQRPGIHRTGGFGATRQVWMEAENLAGPPGFDPWTVQSVDSSYTNWAIPALPNCVEILFFFALCCWQQYLVL
jgi:hypothetical protein